MLTQITISFSRHIPSVPSLEEILAAHEGLKLIHVFSLDTVIGYSLKREAALLSLVPDGRVTGIQFSMRIYSSEGELSVGLSEKDIWTGETGDHGIMVIPVEVLNKCKLLEKELRDQKDPRAKVYVELSIGVK